MCEFSLNVVFPACLSVRVLRTHIFISSHETAQTSSHFAVLTHMCMNDPQLVVLWDASFHLEAEQFGYWQLDYIWLESMTLFSGLGTDVHFSGDETGLQWEGLSLRDAECCGVENGDVKRSR